MPLLVAAATDQTGRTITLLSVGLLAVAAGLTVLTIWYWRFTSPRRRAAGGEIADRAAVDHESTVHEVSSAGQAVEDQPSDQMAKPDLEPVLPPPDDSPPGGLDDEQWAELAQAVMDRYLDTPQ